MLVISPAFCRDFFLILIYWNVRLPTSWSQKSLIRHRADPSKVCVNSLVPSALSATPQSGEFMNSCLSKKNLVLLDKVWKHAFCFHLMDFHWCLSKVNNTQRLLPTGESQLYLLQSKWVTTWKCICCWSILRGCSFCNNHVTFDWIRELCQWIRCILYIQQIQTKPAEIWKTRDCTSITLVQLPKCGLQWGCSNMVTQLQLRSDSYFCFAYCCVPSRKLLRLVKGHRGVTSNFRVTVLRLRYHQSAIISDELFISCSRSLCLRIDSAGQAPVSSCHG